MAAGKWIGGLLGFLQGGALGALAGFALGWLFDNEIDAVNEPYQNREHGQTQSHTNQRGSQWQRVQAERQRNSFLFSFLALASYIIRADGKVMHSEMQTVRNFLRQNFGDCCGQSGFTMVNVADGTNVTMRFGSFKLCFCHFITSSLICPPSTGD